MCPFYNTFQICNFDTGTGTEELTHLEMVAAIVHQLTRNLSMDEIENSSMPFSAAQFQSCGDPITDLMEDMAAEQKTRTTYDNILRMIYAFFPSYFSGKYSSFHIILVEISY